MLVDSDQIKDLAESIAPALPSNPSQEQKDARAQAVTGMQPFLNSLLQYHTDKSEVKNVSVDTGTLHTLPPIVTPADGGVTLYGSTLIPEINGKTLSQNNVGSIE